MWVKLSQPKKFYYYSTSVYADLVLTVYDEDGTLVATLPASALGTTPVDNFYVTAAHTFTLAGKYRMKWTATGLTDWDEAIVTTTPAVNAYPNITETYFTEGTGWGTPQLFILDSDLAEVDDCTFNQLAASVTSSKVVASFTIPAAATVEVTFDAMATTYTASIVVGVTTLLSVLDQLNTQIKYGRAVNSGGSIRIESDSVAETTSVEIGGDAATLTELGLTAGTYTPALGDSPVALTAIDATLAYETGYEVLLPEGNYIFVWADGTTVQTIEDVFIYSDHGMSNVTCEVVDIDTSNALAGVEICIMDSDGKTVRRGYSLYDGRFYTSIEPGTYTAVLRREGCVFGYNNFTLNVADRYDTEYTNDFSLSTSFTRPAYSDMPIVGQSSLSVMKGQFIDLRGQPIAGIRVLISHSYVPFQMTAVDASTVAVSGHPLVAVTDGMGKIEVCLVRGVTVEVAIEGTALHRNILVPNQAEFNLMDNFTQDDLFDIVRLVVPAAVQVDI